MPTECPMNKQEIFNSAYQNSDMYFGWEVRDEFKEQIDQKNVQGFQALEIGAGEGRYSVFLAEHGCSVTAIDFSKIGIAKINALAEEKGLPISGHQCDLKDYSFTEDYYDIIVAATVLEHLEPMVREKTISGIIRSLKPEGLLYVNVFTTSDPGFHAQVNDDHAAASISDTSNCIDHYFEKDELKKSFSELEVIYYYEGVEPDLSHGTPHSHGWACLIAEKKLSS